MVTDLPCVAAADRWRHPCADGSLTRSSRRRMRYRRVAVRRAHLQTVALKSFLNGSLCQSHKSGLNVAATAFVPATFIEADRYGCSLNEVMPDASFCYQQLDEVLECDGVPTHRHPEFYGAVDPTFLGIGVRKCLRETCVVDCLLELPATPTNITVNTSYVPARRMLNETGIAEVLQHIVTPALSTCDVEPVCVETDAGDGITEDSAPQNFEVGDVLRFVDGVKTHILKYSESSSRYCHDEYVRVLRVGGDGRLDVRALSWENPNKQPTFEVRGWLEPFVQDTYICSVVSQLSETGSGSKEQQRIKKY